MEIRVIIECECIDDSQFNVYIEDDLIYGCIVQLFRFMHVHNFRHDNIKDVTFYGTGDQNGTIGTE